MTTTDTCIADHPCLTAMSANTVAVAFPRSYEEGYRDGAISTGVVLFVLICLAAVVTLVRAWQEEAKP